MDDLSGTFQDKAYFRVERKTTFLGMERGEEVKCTNTTLHSTNCIESFTAEGILPRRDELKFEQRTVFFFLFEAREGTRKRSAQTQSFKVELH